jgi:hypothetical protein
MSLAYTTICSSRRTICCAIKLGRNDLLGYRRSPGELLPFRHSMGTRRSGRFALSRHLPQTQIRQQTVERVIIDGELAGDLIDGLQDERVL